MVNGANKSSCSLPRRAVVVIHGIGSQAKFQTLSQFAAGLSETLALNEASAERAYRKFRGKLVPCIQLKLHSDETIDIFEYHYQPHLAHSVSGTDVELFLAQMVTRIRRIYESVAKRKNSTWPDILKKLHEKIKKRKCEFNEQGHLLKTGAGLRSDYFIGRSFLRLSAILLLFLKLLVYLQRYNPSSFPGKFLAWLARLLTSRFVLDHVGDFIAYLAYDNRVPVHEVRRRILDGATTLIGDVVDNYDMVVVAGHSLGSVVAYDAISRLHREDVNQPDTTNQPSINDSDGATGDQDTSTKCSKLASLKRLVIFGSPLDKVALFFWPIEDMVHNKRGLTNTKLIDQAQFSKRYVDFYSKMLAHYQGPLSAFTESQGSKTLNMINFFHQHDPISGPLDLFTCTNRKVDVTETNPIKAHALYWRYQPLYVSVGEGLNLQNMPTNGKSQAGGDNLDQAEKA